MKSRDRRSAFTLIEVLVVALLVTVLFGLVYFFQRGTVRTIQSTENKEDAVRTSHAVYEYIHHRLLNAGEHWSPKQVRDVYEEDEFGGVPLLILPDGALYYPAKGTKLFADDEVAFEGLQTVRFYRREGHLVPFFIAVDRASGPDCGRAFREQSALFGAAFIEAAAAEERYDKFITLGDNHPGCLGGFAALHGFVPPLAK